MTRTVEQQRKIDLALVFILPLGLLFVFVLSKLGYASGSYGDTYIAATHIVIACVTTIPPLIRYTRVLVLPYWFIAVVTVNIYAYGIPLFLGFYDRIWWWDEFAHCMSSMLVAMVVFTALCLIQGVADMVFMSPVMLCFLTFIGGFAFGNIWELFEGTIDWVFGENYMQQYIKDTLTDIHMDFVGSLLMSIISYIILKRKDVPTMVLEMDERRILYNMTHRAR